jgi:hypothetical protein
MFALIWKTVVVAIACLVAADIAGVVVCTVVDILPLLGNSPAFSYAVWLVFGVFCGLFAYNFTGAWSLPKGATGDWSAQPGSSRIGTTILATGTVVVAAVGLALYVVFWRGGGSSEDYVPDNVPRSIVFLISVVAGLAVGRFMLMSDPEKASSNSTL